MAVIVALFETPVNSGPMRVCDVDNDTAAMVEESELEIDALCAVSEFGVVEPLGTVTHTLGPMLVLEQPVWKAMLVDEVVPVML